MFNNRKTKPTEKHPKEEDRDERPKNRRKSFSEKINKITAKFNNKPIKKPIWKDFHEDSNCPGPWCGLKDILNIVTETGEIYIESITLDDYFKMMNTFS